MTILQGKHILLGTSGGIAAYKSAELTRLLIKAGADVRVCMSKGATEFITPLTLQALSGNPVHTELLNPESEAGMGHIELARWADHILIAPATANLIANMAQGCADELLTTLCLASSAPVSIAPAMNQQMWKHAATQANITTLRQRGVNMLGPDQGEQACGDVGPGRMLEPTAITKQLEQYYNLDLPLKGTRVLITAGPTREAIDPVRFLTNRSSGKMGYSIAAAAQALGADVVLVSGPVALDTPIDVKRVNVESADDMLHATRTEAKQADIFIATAAVADYTLAEVAEHKIKKSDETLQLEMTRTVDILATMSKEFKSLFTVGFAAETRDLLKYARGKLERKGVQMIAANSVADGKAFDKDSNALEVVWKDGSHSFPEMSKTQLASELMRLITQRYKDRT
uniref:Coenzyme A biosynthesis bifunctional protein CoaBC n=1 Tax=uncultured Thiotrichaceae bacterium TaxID=298394 RepID=A0A6S6U8Z1_9GAMM|nr:MAG: Phosphopantothenoylcysteine decarboxylase (EC / Phosphopantothenoylcysteine synthetase (EC [uncultured Thiotrichaceae bacterium]